MKEVLYPSITKSPQEYLAGCSIMGSLGKYEAEKVLEILLRFSWQGNRWLMVSLKEFNQVLQEMNEGKRERTFTFAKDPQIGVDYMLMNGYLEFEDEFMKVTEKALQRLK